MSGVKIPVSDMSDIDKGNIKIFSSIFKTLQTASSIDASFFYSPLNQQYFIDFVNYLATHFEENVDKNIKRLISIIMRDIFMDLNGMSNLPQYAKRQSESNGGS
jgi:hypothetical protein